MDRREAIKRTALLLGVSVVGAELFLTGCGNKQEGDSLLFNSSDLLLLDEIGETILPESDRSPGAKAAKIGLFMTGMVSECYDEEDQKIFTDGLVELNKRCQTSYNKDFVGLAEEERVAVLTIYDQEAGQWQKEGRTHFYALIKQLTILGYFTSEIGVTQALRYQPVPGSYDGCVPHKEGTPAWFGPLSSIG